MKPRHPSLIEYEQRMDALPVTERCLFCPWEWEGTALEGRTEALTHRLRVHPEVKPTRRKRGGHLQSFRQSRLKKADWEEIYAERAKRALVTGVDLSSETA